MATAREGAYHSIRFMLVSLLLMVAGCSNSSDSDGSSGDGEQSPPVYQVLLPLAGSGTGAVSGSGSYTEGETATVSATCDLGSTFTGWAGPDRDLCDLGSFLVMADTDCTALCELPPTNNLVVQKNGTGSGTVVSTSPGIDCGTNCMRLFNEDSTVTVTTSAGIGSAFTGWSGDCSMIHRNQCTVDTDADKVVTASFDVCGTRECKLTTSDGADGDGFGISVAFDGDVIVVGADGDDDNDADASGSAYVYRFDGADWIEEQKLTASDGAADNLFGGSVALDGEVIVVGARLDDENGSGSGSAYVYRFDGADWVEEQKLTASDGEKRDFFGKSVSLDRDVIVVGANADDDNGINSGSAYVYRFDGADWVEEQKLTASDGEANEAYGWTVAIDRGVRDVIVIGAHLDDDNESDTGSAYVYGFDGMGWVEEQKLVASDGAASDAFGFSVAIDGDVIVVGAPFVDDEPKMTPVACGGGIMSSSAVNIGAAYAFRFDGLKWAEEQKLTAFNLLNSPFRPDCWAHDRFGFSVAVDGDAIASGAPLVDDPPSSTPVVENVGAAYVHRFNGVAWVAEQKLTDPEGGAGDDQGYSVALDPNVLVVGGVHDDDNGEESGSVSVYEL